MAVTTHIEWCDSTLNLQMGCDGCELWRPDQGVRRCYAGQITQRYGGKSPGYPASFEQPKLFIERLRDVIKWSDLTGTAREDKPWLNGHPRLIFLNDMGDTFTESLPVDWLNNIFTVCPKGHPFPIVQYLEKDDVCCCSRCAITWKAEPLILAMMRVPHNYLILSKRPRRMAEYFGNKVLQQFWLGTSITSRATLPRIAALRAIPGYTKFLSIEPLIEDIGKIDLSRIDWVIVGGESGPSARHMNLDWARSLRDQCREANIPYFFKQKGGVRDKGGDLASIPEDLRIRELPAPAGVPVIL